MRGVELCRAGGREGGEVGGVVVRAGQRLLGDDVPADEPAPADTAQRVVATPQPSEAPSSPSAQGGGKKRGGDDEDFE